MYKCKVLADSINGCGVRLTTMEVTFPRIVLSEFNTHRVFSRNSSSSRAIPSSKIIARVIDDPFVPFYWGKNQKGMAAFQVLDPATAELAEAEWLGARDDMVRRVNNLLALDVHKQIANRLLEPFVWQTVIVSATTWDNFFNLRRDENAQPEIKRAADDMYECWNNSVPVFLNEGEWHMPLMDDLLDLKKVYSDEDIRKICVGRVCRISYLTHNGVRDAVEDINLCNSLSKNGHMSPFEHIAMSVNDKEIYGNFVGWKQYRKFFVNESIFLK